MDCLWKLDHNNIFPEDTLKSAQRDQTAVWLETGAWPDGEPVVLICVATYVVGYRKKSNSESLYQAVAERNRLNDPLKCWATLDKKGSGEYERIILRLDIPATAASVMAH